MMKKMPEYEKPFVEKYRPKVLDDVVGNSIAVDQLKAISQKGNLPNIIIVVSISKFLIPAIFTDICLGTPRNRKDFQCNVLS